MLTLSHERDWEDGTVCCCCGSYVTEDIDDFHNVNVGITMLISDKVECTLPDTENYKFHLVRLGDTVLHIKHRLQGANDD